jgi:hypothetical protein
MKIAIYSFVLNLVLVLTSCGGGGGSSSSGNSLPSASILQRAGFLTGVSPVLMVSE